MLMVSVLLRGASTTLETTKGVRIVLVKTAGRCLILILLGAAVPGPSYAGGMMPSEKAEQELLEAVTEAGHRLGWRTATSGNYVMDFPEGRILREIKWSATVFSLSPDAKRLAFFDTRSSSVASLWMPMDLVVADVETGERKPLGLVVRDPSLLAWSPDGQKLALIAALASTDTQGVPQGLLVERSYGLFIFTLAEKSLEVFDLDGVNSAMTGSDQIWSPDGNEVVCGVLHEAKPPFHPEIWIVDLATKSKRLLAKGDLPTWSPVDSRIVFRGEDDNFYMIRADGSNRELLLKPKPRFVHLYDLLSPFLWSPDGRWLLVPRGSAPGTDDLFVMDPKTKIMVRIQSRTQPRGSWKGRRK